METQIKTLNFYNKKLEDVLPQLESWLIMDDYKCQHFTLDNGQVALQIKKSGFFRGLVGMNTALNVVFHKMGDDKFNIEIGEGKWVDKIVVGTLSMLLLWPILPFVGYGVYLQANPPNRIFERLEGLTSSTMNS